MVRFGKIALIVLVVFLVHEVSCGRKQEKYDKKNKDKYGEKVNEKQKWAKVDSSVGDGKTKYYKHQRNSRSVVEEVSSPVEEQPSFVTEKAKKYKMKTPSFQDSGVSESSCSCDKKSKNQAIEPTKKKVKYVLVEESEEEPSVEETVTRYVVDQTNTAKKQKKSKQQKPKPSVRYVVEEERIVAEEEPEEPEYRVVVNKKQQKPVYVREEVIEDEPEVNVQENLREALPRVVKVESENRTGKRRVIEEVDETMNDEEEY